MKRSNGGYRPDSRLETNGDEIVMTLMEAVRARTPEQRRRALKEAVQLTRERFALLAYINGGQPPLGAAAGA